MASRRASRSTRRTPAASSGRSLGHDLDRHLAAEGGIEGAVDDGPFPPVPEGRVPRTARARRRALADRGSPPPSRARPPRRRDRGGRRPAGALPRRSSASLSSSATRARSSAFFAAGLVEKARALGGGAVEGGVEQLVEPRPVLSLKHRPGSLGAGSSSARSQARARIHPRWAVRSESPSARAVSASSRPPKKRHSKMRASSRSRSRRRSSALSTSRSRSGDARRRGQPLLVELLGGLARAALLAQPCACAIDEDLPHDAGGHRHEMVPVLELEALARGQLQVGLVHEAGGVEGIAGGPAAQVAPGQAPQLVVDERHHPVQGVARPRPRGPVEAP